VVEARDVVRVYGSGEARVVALGGVSLSVERGQFVAVMGPSGSGKSTLLHCLAGLDTPTSGSVLIAGQDLAGMNDKQLTRVRRDRLGFVFQAFNLLPTLSAEENILLPLRLARRKPDEQWYRAVIDSLGIADRLDHRPAPVCSPPFLARRSQRLSARSVRVTVSAGLSAPCFPRGAVRQG